MRICAAEPERGHGSSSWAVVEWPWHVLGRDEKSRRRRIDARVPLGEVQIRRNSTVLHGKRGLDETRNTCRRLEVPQVGLRGSQRAGLRAGTIGLCERLEIDAITKDGAGALAF